jgi:hypothetical protein
MDNVKPQIVDKFFSPEEIELLGPSFGLLPGGVRPFVPKAYVDNIKDKTKWPLFMIKAPDSRDLNEIENSVGQIQYGADMKPTAYKFNSGTARELTLKRCLVKFSNFRNNAGPVECTLDAEGRISDQALLKIHPNLQEEIKKAILSGATLTEEEIQGLSY